MTPEQIKERAKKIRETEDKISILEDPKCYLIISDNKVYFRTERTEPVHVEENIKNVWLLLESTFKVATIKMLKDQIHNLCKEPE